MIMYYCIKKKMNWIILQVHKLKPGRENESFSLPGFLFGD